MRLNGQYLETRPGGTGLCPRVRHFILRSVLVQPRKTGNCPDMAEKLLAGT